MNLIISIEKKYFDLMLKGLKKYEFRRKFINDPCNAFIYIYQIHIRKYKVI